MLQLHDKLATWACVTRDGVSGVRGVMACSALKQQYRDILCGSHQHGTDLTNQIKFIYLRGSRDVIVKRVESRVDHFMPSSLLDTQFSDLEEPLIDSVTVDITLGVEEIVTALMETLNLDQPTAS